MSENKNNKVKEPIIPDLDFFTSNMLDLQNNPLNFYYNTYKNYGDYVKFDFKPSISFYALFHPDAVQHIFNKNQNNYKKPAMFNVTMESFVGQGILISEGETWLKQRRVLQPVFHKKHLESLFNTITDSLTDTLKDWGRFNIKRVIDISDEMNRITAKILVKVLLGVDLTDKSNNLSKSFRDVFEYDNYEKNPIWASNKKYKIDKITFEIIKLKRQKQIPDDDVLSFLMSLTDEETGNKMSDLQLRDQILNLLLAGHDTTKSALTWTFYMLAKNYNSISTKNLIDEIDSVLKRDLCKYEYLPKLQYTKMFFNESIRLYPPAWGQPREAIEDDFIEGYLIKKNCIINLSQYATHRHDDFWEKPHEFYPEHFETSLVEKRHKFAYFPFGGGPRICIGINLAIMIAQATLSTLAQFFKFELIPEQKIIADTSFTLAPKNGIKVNLSKRISF